MHTGTALLQLGFCAATATAAAGLTVYRLRTRNLHGRDAGDGAFWTSFLGLLVLLPAVFIPAVSDPAAGALLALLTVAVSGLAYLCGPGLELRRRRRHRDRAAARSAAAAAARHRAALAHWQRYELDLGWLIEYPAMSDISRPATAALIRSMGEAERAGSAALPGTAAAREYAHCVLRFERRLSEAERAAGVPAAEQWAWVPEAGALPAADLAAHS